MITIPFFFALYVLRFIIIIFAFFLTQNAKQIGFETFSLHPLLKSSNNNNKEEEEEEKIQDSLNPFLDHFVG
jgi:hypothetical protein